MILKRKVAFVVAIGILLAIGSAVGHIIGKAGKEQGYELNLPRHIKNRGAGALKTKTVAQWDKMLARDPNNIITLSYTAAGHEHTTKTVITTKPLPTTTGALPNTHAIPGCTIAVATHIA